jgi:hypothetical protein
MRQHAAYTQPIYGEVPSLRRGASELHKTRKRPDATPPGDTVPVGVRWLR